MSTEKLLLQPGVNVQASQTLNAASWSKSNLIRFHQGYLQKMGGWQKMDEVQFVGVCRALHAWTDLDTNNYLAIGTNERLQVYSRGDLTDITPLGRTASIANAFTFTAGSSQVRITDPGSNARVGDWVEIPIEMFANGAGFFLKGHYKITDVIDGDNYIIDAAPNVSAVTSAGNGFTPLFATTNGSNVVQVGLEAHGFEDGDSFFVVEPVTVGGITLQSQFYLVDTIVNANNFTIRAASGATFAGNARENGNQAIINYLLAAGLVSTEHLVGWGAGGYGEGPYGLDSASGGVSTQSLRLWSLDNFGENLLAQVNNGELYEWIPPVAPNNRATEVVEAPSNNWGMFVAMPQAQVIIYGAETTGIQDPLLIRWSDAGNYHQWTPSSVNQAGSYRLSRGSRIVGGLQAPLGGLIWSDIDLWSMQYIAQPFIYSVTMVASNCGLIAKNAAVRIAGATYWMGRKNFYRFSGGHVEAVPCSVWDEVFDDIDADNADKAVAAGNSGFSEIMWFYPSLSGSTGEIDSYVKFNVVGGTWDYGSGLSIARTAWIDESIFGSPIGADLEMYLQQHEIGMDADETAMKDVFVESGYADLAQGSEFLFVDHLIPDFVWRSVEGANPSLTLTILTTDYPNKAPVVHGPFTVTPETEFVTVRARARQIAVRVESDGKGVFWRLGAMRYRSAPAGREI